MYQDMEKWAEIRRRVLTGKISKRKACSEYDIHWDTLQKMLEYPEPPGYRQKQPRKKPKLEPFLPIIHEILKADQQAPRKQRHKAQRIFERLRDEYGFAGGLTIVKDAVRAWRTGSPFKLSLDCSRLCIRLSSANLRSSLDFVHAQGD